MNTNSMSSCHGRRAMISFSYFFLFSSLLRAESPSSCIISHVISQLSHGLGLVEPVGFGLYSRRIDRSKQSTWSQRLRRRSWWLSKCWTTNRRRRSSSAWRSSPRAYRRPSSAGESRLDWTAVDSPTARRGRRAGRARPPDPLRLLMLSIIHPRSARMVLRGIGHRTTVLLLPAASNRAEGDGRQTLSRSEKGKQLDDDDDSDDAASMRPRSSILNDGQIIESTRVSLKASSRLGFVSQ